MATSALSIEKDLISQFRRILPTLLPQVTVVSGREETRLGDLAIDLRLRLKIGKVEKSCLFEMKASGSPRLIFEAIGRLSIAKKRMPEAYTVVVTPFISREGKQLCKEAGIGYITLSGEAWLQFDTVFIERDLGEKPANMPEAFSRLLGSLKKLPQELDLSKRIRRMPFPFSAKASRVLRLLLENPRQTWTTTRLANEAQVALRIALLVVNYLADKLLVKKERGAIALLKPQELLQLWADEYQFKKFNRIIPYYSFERSFEEFLENLKLFGTPYQDRYALTLFSGASLVAPYTRVAEKYLYVLDNPQVWAETLKLRPVESGANTFLVIPFDEKVLYKSQQIQGVTVASTIQLYLDLFNYNDRAREQAHVLLKQAIHFPA